MKMKKYIRVWWKVNSKGGTVEDIEVTEDFSLMTIDNNPNLHYYQFHSTISSRAIGGEFGPKNTWRYSDWR
jgi:hypothetical protein